MPGDRPHHSEKMRACVEEVMAKGHEESSAYAICTASLQKAGEPIFAQAKAGSEEEQRLLLEYEHPRDLHLLRATGAPRVDTVNGRSHLIVPCVALMETVIHAVNSDIPELVPLSTLKDAAETWNGKPVLLGHPIYNGKQLSASAPGVYDAHGIGVIRNAKVEGRKLCLEACLDPERVKRVAGAPFLEELRAGKNHIEVSVGAFAITEPETSTFDGKEYKAVWRGARGDHLALLPHSRGACSVEAGCGTHRAAEYYVASEEFRTACSCEVKELRDISQKERDKIKDSDFAGKGQSFPIRTPEDVAAAARSIGRAGSDNYSTEQLKRNIIRIAKRKGPSFVARLPEAWKEELKNAEALVMPTTGDDLLQCLHDQVVSMGAKCTHDASSPVVVMAARYLADSLVGESLDARMSAVTRAVQRTFNGDTAAIPLETPPAFTGAYVVAVYDDHVIISKGDKYFSIDYRVEKDASITLKDKQTEVKQAFVAAEAPPDPIRMEGGRWMVYNADGTRRLGSHATREEAEAQQQAIVRSLVRQQHVA